MTPEDELASKQRQMRDRWANRPANGKPANSRPILPVRVSVQRTKSRVVKSNSPRPERVALLPTINPAPAMPIFRRAERTAHRNQRQEPLALGFSLGFPQLGSDIPPPKLSMRVCAVHPAITRANARSAGTGACQRQRNEDADDPTRYS